MNRPRRLPLSVYAFLFAISTVGAQTADPVVAAYEKEAAYLDDEIALLRKRIEEVSADGEARVQSARKALDALEVELLSLSSSVDRREDEFRVIQEERDDVVGATDILESIVAQSEARLEGFGVPVFAISDSVNEGAFTGDELIQQKLRYSFDSSLGLLEKLGTRYTEAGRFFLSDGTEVEGEIIHLGRIASFGVAGSAGGTLAPAGAGKLRVVEAASARVARLLNRGDEPGTLPIYLYESLDYFVDRTGSRSIGEIINSGGIIAYIIVLLGAAAAALIALRGFLLYRSSRVESPFLDKVITHVRGHDYEAAKAVIVRPKSSLERVVMSAVWGLSIDPKRIDDIIAESILNEQPVLERFRSAITVFAAVAPLLGLLGTVTGMISTFDVITEYGTGDPKLLSGGISEALVTTELGLIVAIPALLLGNLLTGWADRIAGRIEVSALRVINSASGFDEHIMDEHIEDERMIPADEPIGSDS